jgi:hypothetical protein
VKDDTTYGLSPEQLGRLMALGLEGPDAQKRLAATRKPARAFQEMFTNKLPLNPVNPDSLPAVLNRSCDEFLSVADRTMGDLLLNPETDLVIIKSLKDYGKELVRRGGREAKQAAATTVYYAAIASALVFHREKITQHPYQKLHEAYAELRGKSWVSHQLKELFRKARVVCQHQKHISE